MTSSDFRVGLGWKGAPFGAWVAVVSGECQRDTAPSASIWEGGVPPAVYGQAVTHTAPSRAGMVQTLLWQPPEPQYRPTAVESMSSRAGDKRRV